jgi:hypothetical protein
MSHTLEEVFKVFKDKFPPADSIESASLQLTTSQIAETINNLSPTLVGEDFNWLNFLIGQGYTYAPKVYNERVEFYWLLREKDSETSG